MNTMQVEADSKPWSMAVKAVLLDPQDRMLLIRRSNKNSHFVGKWEWPGGKVDPGEDFATAVKREAREETALEIAIIGLAGATSFEMPQVRIVMLCLECRVMGGQLQLSKEHDDFAWVFLRDLGNWPLTDQVRSFMLDYATRKVHRDE